MGHSAASPAKDPAGSRIPPRPQAATNDRWPRLESQGHHGRPALPRPKGGREGRGSASVVLRAARGGRSCLRTATGAPKGGRWAPGAEGGVRVARAARYVLLSIENAGPRCFTKWARSWPPPRNSLHKRSFWGEDEKAPARGPGPFVDRHRLPRTRGDGARGLVPIVCASQGGTGFTGGRLRGPKGGRWSARRSGGTVSAGEAMRYVPMYRVGERSLFHEMGHLLGNMCFVPARSELFVRSEEGHHLPARIRGDDTPTRCRRPRLPAHP
ncbi:MAG: hypothetical protein JWM86_887 [Thermoleophilia bacterium]|nr:hypothetical protein [Thermoleophilia bacterium]